ncbi:MAG: ABC transporter permease subunit [Xanthomonadales bacterium]|nr:ABC transporter permease subunit [Xanthomonadales bacterium]MCB1627301.1 ABC transporter permease subunit [Xanthomonadales bacterium]MCB1634188.1 ABC transporter permease subunit [Xanthomonadales bacterium]MCB1641810.1 ABC transporter permease subunit [Xanthomonadales bacterium]
MNPYPWRGPLSRLTGGLLVLLLAGFLLVGMSVLLGGVAGLAPRPLLQVELRDQPPLAGLLLQTEVTHLDLLTGIDAGRVRWQRLPREQVMSISEPTAACAASNAEGELLVQSPCTADPQRWQLAFPNDGRWLAGLGRWYDSLRNFLLAPARADGQGGISAALVGTFVLVLLMTLLVLPFGVAVGLYLAEFAGTTRHTRWLRQVLAQLAAIPSVVYGLVGLGLFVHGFGHQIDQWFHADRLPSPTYASGGLLWASLVLALLTLPLVVVVSEQGFRRVPGGLREASLALGATRSETIFGVLLPAARPALLTALILAIARASAEVAPLLLVGAVRYAAQLPISTEAPFLHLERPFMHLGYRVLDLATSAGGHTLAVQQAFACALALLLLVLALNGAAIYARAILRLRHEKLSP